MHLSAARPADLARPLVLKPVHMSLCGYVQAQASEANLAEADGFANESYYVAAQAQEQRGCQTRQMSHHVRASIMPASELWRACVLRPRAMNIKAVLATTQARRLRHWSWSVVAIVRGDAVQNSLDSNSTNSIACARLCPSHEVLTSSSQLAQGVRFGCGCHLAL